MTRIYKTTLIVICLTVCAVLGIVLFTLSAEPAIMTGQLAPYLLIGLIGLAILILSPIGNEPDRPDARPASLLELTVTCTGRLGWLQCFAVAAIGILAGALLGEILKLDA